MLPGAAAHRTHHTILSSALGRLARAARLVLGGGDVPREVLQLGELGLEGL